MTDPYYAGITEPNDEWVRPPSPACPDCPCCTLPLCIRARTTGLPCWVLGTAGPDVMDLSACPCSTPGG